MTTTILIIVNVFSALAIIILALMQQSKGDMGSAFGGGGSQSMFGSRGSANFLSRMTALMCVVFFISSLSLAYVYAKRADNNSVVQEQSVLDQVEASSADSEVPMLEASGDENELPEIPGTNEAADAIEDGADNTQEAIEQGADAVEDAVDSAADEVENN
jgi:preprotein translocase subunit SecG